MHAVRIKAVACRLVPQMTTTEKDSDNIEKRALKNTKNIEMANYVYF